MLTRIKINLALHYSVCWSSVLSRIIIVRRLVGWGLALVGGLALIRGLALVGVTLRA